MTAVEPGSAAPTSLLERENELSTAPEWVLRLPELEWQRGSSYRKLDIRGRGALANALGTRP